MRNRLLLSGAITLVLLGIVALVALTGFELPGSARPAIATPTRESTPILRSGNQVILAPKSWNNGMVHIWADLVDGPDAKYTDVVGGTICDKADHNIYMLGEGNTAISYYKVKCGEISGYVEVDQTR